MYFGVSSAFVLMHRFVCLFLYVGRWQWICRPRQQTRMRLVVGVCLYVFIDICVCFYGVCVRARVCFCVCMIVGGCIFVCVCLPICL